MKKITKPKNYKKRKNYFVKYRKNHKEDYRLASSKYYKNKEKIKAKNKKYYEKITKLLLTIPLITIPFFCYSCKNKDIERIGKEIENKINGKNQKLIEKLNEIIDKLRENN